jgi:hypothetical protein
LIVAIAGCDDPESPPDEAGEVVGTAKGEIQGVDGALTVNAANTVLNQYAVLSANAAAGASTVSVTNIAHLGGARRAGRR